MNKPKEKKKAGRKNAKRPALNKSLNIFSRRDFIETQYIDGVYDEDGKELIRPLNEEEKDFLNSFYEETVIASFSHDQEIRRLNAIKKQIIEDEDVMALKSHLEVLKEDKDLNKKAIAQLKEIIRLTKKQNEEKYESELEYVENALQERREEVLLYPDKEDHKEFYKANNARNTCIFNKMKSQHRLEYLEPEKYDQMVSRKLQGIDLENILVNKLDNEVFKDTTNDGKNRGNKSKLKGK